MTPSPESAAHWLAAARAGSQEALGQMLDDCRAYLLLLARQALDADLQAKAGPSDLVQETFLEAYRDFDQFHGTTTDELLAWLRQLLHNNVANFRRGYRTYAKRRVTLEQSLGQSDSSSGPTGQVAAGGASPSELASEHEQAEALDRAIAALPDDYRQVLLLRHQEGLSFEIIGQRMARSANAVEKLWLRAVERLRQRLETPP
jgi:RNA polymerase sigma-70 factor (ECF subfamily)